MAFSDFEHLHTPIQISANLIATIKSRKVERSGKQCTIRPDVELKSKQFQNRAQ